MGANPYNAPDAELRGDDDVYDPSIFSFSGRIGRLRYLAYTVGMMILLMLAMIPLVGVSAVTGGQAEGMSMVGMLVMMVAYLAGIIMGVMFAKRRLNDLNRSGWWLLLNLVPVANLLLTIYMVFFPGTDSSNNWGPAPGPNSLGVQILGWSMPALFILGILAAVLLPAMVGVPAQ